MAPRDRFEDHDPTAATFVVVIEGREAGTFSEVSGLEFSLEESKIVEGGQNGYVHRFPGRMIWPNVVLKRGVAEHDVLFEWAQRCSGDGYAGARNRLERTTVTVYLYGWDGEDLRAWDLLDAFPVKWKGPNFSRGSNEMAVEELEIAHHGITARVP